MNNKVIIITILMILLSINISSAADFIVPKYILVGLESYYKELEKVEIKSQTIIGNVMNGDTFTPVVELNSKAGFTATTDNNFYIKANNNFTNYEDALVFASKLNTSDFQASPVYIAGEIWTVYIGPFYTREEMNFAYTTLQNQNSEVQFGKVEQNIKRNNIILKDSNKKVIFENLDEYICFSAKSGTIDLVTRNYRGYIQFVRVASGKITAVNKVKFNEYLYSVVGTEMSASWPLEALKAQAVAARNYAVLTVNAKKYKYYDISDTTNDQAYKGFAVEGVATNRAVDETNGQVLLHENTVVNAFYSSSSGGYTENSENVWLNKLPYLRAVKDLYEAKNSNSSWTVQISKSAVRKLILDGGQDIGDIRNMYTVNSSESGRVLELIIEGTMGTKKLTKESIRTFFTPHIGSQLKSRNFKILSGGSTNTAYALGTGIDKTISMQNAYVIGSSGVVKKIDSSASDIYMQGTNLTNKVGEKSAYSGESFVIQGSGWGHGVGMSQYGAKGMAEAGFKYDEILKYYYTGTRLEQR